MKTMCMSSPFHDEKSEDQRYEIICSKSLIISIHMFGIECKMTKKSQKAKALLCITRALRIFCMVINK